MKVLTAAEFVRALDDPHARETLSPAAGVDLVCTTGKLPSIPADRLPVCPLISLDPHNPPADAVIDESDLDELAQQVTRQPYAAATLVHVMRHNARLDITGALTLESLAYSTLQHSSGFQDWLKKRTAQASSPAATTEEDNEPVLMDREDNTLYLTLNRPSRHNAYNSRMRDGLCAGLELACADSSIDLVDLYGNGPSFCAGGDLDEFGSAGDAANAHATRLTRSAGYLMNLLHERTRCNLHGACIGAGIELPAFSADISAREDASFQLPELSMGLIPGAGGTVSLSRRIGRQRTTLMALTCTSVDAATALDWGLIDHLTAG